MVTNKLDLSNKTIALTVISRAGQAVGSVMLLLLTARWGGAAVRGEISMLLASLTLGSHLASWVGGGTLVYLANRYHPGKLLLYSLLWSSAVSVLTGLLLPATPFGLSMSTTKWITALLLLNTTVVLRSMLVALNRIRVDNLLGLLGIAIQLMITLYIMGYLGQPDLAAFLMAFNGGQIAVLLLAGFELRRAIPGTQPSPESGSPPSHSLLSDMIRTGSWAQVASLSQFFAYRLLYYYLSTRDDLDSVGRFSVAVAIGESVWLLTRSVSLSQATAISRMKDEQEARQLTRKWYKRVGYVSAMAIGLLVLIPNSLWIYIIGPEYSGIPGLLAAMAPGLWLLAQSNILAHHHAGTGRYAVNAYASLATLLTLPVGLLLLPRPASLVTIAALQSLAYLMGWVVQYRHFRPESRQNCAQGPASTQPGPHGIEQPGL